MSEEAEDKNKRSWFDRLKMLIREPQDRAQLMEVLRDAEDRHILSAETLSMIESVLQVSDMHVREVMVPKSQMVVVEHDHPLEMILPLVIESGHSRFPIVDDTGDVIGILLAKDLLKYCFKKVASDFSLNDVLRAAV